MRSNIRCIEWVTRFFPRMEQWDVHPSIISGATLCDERRNSFSPRQRGSTLTQRIRIECVERTQQTGEAPNPAVAFPHQMRSERAAAPRPIIRLKRRLGGTLEMQKGSQYSLHQSHITRSQHVSSRSLRIKCKDQCTLAYTCTSTTGDRLCRSACGCESCRAAETT